VEAERAYALLAGELVPPRGIVDLVLFDNVDFSNGFTTVFPSNRIAVYVSPPAGDPILAPYDDWLRLVITHELTHVFHLDRTRGLWRVAQRVLGRAPGSFPNAYQPSWVSEGLATYYESRLTAGGRLRASLHDQILASAAKDHRWPRPGDATLLSPVWPGGFRPYAWGSHFFQWQARAAGDSVVPRFVERTSKNLWPLLVLPWPGVSPAMKGAGGVGVDSAWRALRAAWLERAAGPAGARSIVARGLRVEPRPRVSPDGRLLAYVQADGRTDVQVVIREIGSGRVAARHRANADIQPWWKGDTLYLAQLDFTSPVDIRSALYRWLPGGRWERVPGSQRLARPFVGPGGQLWAVDWASRSRSVVALGPSGRREMALPEADAWGFLVCSPDGNWMAGARHREGRWDIVLWPWDRPEEAVAVTDDAAWDDDPVFAPSGNELWFASERSGLPQILAYRMHTGELIQITSEPTGARQPAPAPDGSLYYATILSDGWAVVRAQALALPAPAPAATVQAPETRVAQPVVRRATGYRPWPSLAPRFWLPVWHDVGTAGRFAGALTAGADAIGRTAYVAQLALAPAKGRLEGALALSHQRWRALSLDASYVASWDSLLSRRGLLSRPDSTVDTVLVTYGDIKQTASLGGTFTWRRWRTAIAVRVGSELESERLVVDRVDRGPAGIRLRKDRLTFAGPVLSLSAQHLSLPALAISPENGVALGALYRYRTELGGTGWWWELRGSGTGYAALSLPGFAHWVLAVRGAVGWRGGPSAEGYEIGGASGSALEVLPGYAVGPSRRLFGLRGYSPVSTSFTRASSLAAELRIPVALVAKAAWRLPLGLDRLSLSGFFEAAGGWRAGEPARPLAYRDAGGELVADAAVPLDVSVRARLGFAVPMVSGLGTRAGKPAVYLAFGSAF